MGFVGGEGDQTLYVVVVVVVVAFLVIVVVVVVIVVVVLVRDMRYQRIICEAFLHGKGGNSSTGKKD